MKIKIIKRAVSEGIMETIQPAKNDHLAKTDVRKATATVKIWIDDLRRKREQERLSVRQLLGEERCT